MIKAPKHNLKREVARTIVEAFAQSNPLTGAAARLFQFTSPSQYEKEKEAWTLDITDRVNAHDDAVQIFYEYLFPKISISQDALALAKVLIDTSEEGLEDFIEFEEAKDLLPEMSNEELELAIAELQHYDFVFFDSGMMIRRKLSLYAAFDSIFYNKDVVSDAKILAQHLLEDKSNYIIAELFKKTSWSHRRFNPALGYLLECLPEIRSFNDFQSSFPAAQILLDAGAKFSLMKFLKESPDRPTTDLDALPPLP